MVAKFPELQKALEGARGKLVKPEAELLRIEKEIQDRISSTIEKESSRPIQLSWLPSDSARTSIFQPIADQQLKDVARNLVFKSAWGQLTVVGPPLNITDEGVFLALLYQVRKSKSPIVKVNFKQICELLRITYQSRNIARIKASIKKLSHVNFDFELKDGTWSVERILRSAMGNNDFSVVEVDKWFYAKFLQNEITLIDLELRQSLNGDIAKALYRLLSSHSGVQQYRVETLILALNLNPDRELKYHTRALKGAFSQLRNRKFLTYKFKDNLFFEIRILAGASK